MFVVQSNSIISEVVIKVFHRQSSVDLSGIFALKDRQILRFRQAGLSALKPNKSSRRVLGAWRPSTPGGSDRIVLGASVRFFDRF